MRTTLVAVALCSLVSACASPRKVLPDGGNVRDAATNLPDLTDPIIEYDFSTPAPPPDLYGVDLFGRDLAMPSPDLRQPNDLAVNPDLTKPVDMASSTCTPPVSGGSCDTTPQCGCSGGQNCSVVNNTTGVTGCVATGSTVTWGNCTGSGAGQCGVGTTCVDGVCATYCDSVADCPGAYRNCTQVSASGTPVPGFFTCSLTCDPVAPTTDNATFDACGPNVFCYPSSTGTSFCAGPTTPTGTQGADCSAADSDCAAGYICLQDSAVSYSCYKYCHVGSNVNCTGGRTCQAFTTAQFAANVGIGYCDF